MAQTAQDIQRERIRRERERRQQENLANVGAAPENSATLFEGGTIEEQTGFLPGVMRSMDPRPLIEAAKNPIDTARSVLYEQPIARLREAYEASNGRATPESVHGLRESIPLFGPIIQGLRERVESGDRAGAFGEMVGMVFPEFIRLPRIPDVPAASGPLPKTRGQRTGSMRGIEETVARIPGGRGPFKALEDLQQAEAVRITNELVESVSRGATTADEIDIGARFLESLDSAEARLNAPARAIYDELDQAIPAAGIRPSTGGLKEFAQPLLDRLNDESNLIPAGDLASTRATLETIMEAPDTLPFRAFQDARSDLLRAARAFNDPLPGRRAGVVSQLAGITDRAMRDALTEAGRTDLLTKLDEANAIWRSTSETLADKTIVRLMAAEPDRVPQILSVAPTASIRRLRNVVPQETFNDAAAIVLRDAIIEPAVGGQVPEAILNQAGVADAAQTAQQTVSPQLLRNRLRRMRGRLAELVGDEVATSITEVTADLFNIKEKRASGVVFPLVASGAVVGPFAAALTGILSGSAPVGVAAGLGGAAAIAAGMNAFARWSVAQPGNRSLLRRFVNAVNTGNAQNAAVVAQLINASMRESQERIPMLRSSQ